VNGGFSSPPQARNALCPVVSFALLLGFALIQEYCRKSQRVLVRLAEFIRPFGGLGDQIVRIFRGKKKFPIPLEAEKKNFNHLI